MRAFIAALAFSGLCSVPAVAEPVVSPLGDGGGIYNFHRLEKYQLYNAPTGVTHSGGTMRWYYNDANRPSSIGKSSAIARIQSAMAQWSAVCRISFAYQGETTTGFSLPSSTFDGVNVVGWDATTLSAPTTGITSVAWNGSNTFIDAEIRFNAAYSATVSAFDATAVHEVGHALGLDHSDVSGQVMSGPPLTSYNGRSALSADDIAGCVRLYGAPGGSTADTQAPSIPAALSAAAVSSTASTSRGVPPATTWRDAVRGLSQRRVAGQRDAATALPSRTSRPRRRTASRVARVRCAGNCSRNPRSVVGHHAGTCLRPRAATRTCGGRRARTAGASPSRSTATGCSSPGMCTTPPASRRGWSCPRGSGMPRAARTRVTSTFRRVRGTATTTARASARAPRRAAHRSPSTPTRPACSRTT